MNVRINSDDNLSLEINLVTYITTKLVWYFFNDKYKYYLINASEN